MNQFYSQTILILLYIPGVKTPGYSMKTLSVLNIFQFRVFVTLSEVEM